MTDNSAIDPKNPPEPGAKLVSVPPSERNGKPVRAYQYWRGADGKRIGNVEYTDAPIEDAPKLSKKSNAKIVTPDDVDSITSSEELAILSKSDDSDIVERVSINSHASLETLRELSKSDDWELRENVAKNPSTSHEILMELSMDDDSDVRQAAVKNSIEQYKKANPDIVKSVREHPFDDEFRRVAYLTKDDRDNRLPGQFDSLDEPGHPGWLFKTMCGFADNDDDTMTDRYKEFLREVPYTEDVALGDFPSASDSYEQAEFRVWGPSETSMTYLNAYGIYVDYMSLSNKREERDKEIDDITLATLRYGYGTDENDEPNKYSLMSNEEWATVLNDPDKRAEAIETIEDNVTFEEYENTTVSDDYWEDM